MAAWFKLLLPTLATAHTVLAIEIALITSCAFLLPTRQVSRLAAAAATTVFIAILVAFAHRLYINHRWDSATCAVLSVTILALYPNRPKLVALSGLFAGLAVVFTPPALIVGVGLAGCLFADRHSRGQVALFAGATIVPLAASALVLATDGSLLPFLRNSFWVSQRYRQANRVPYGFVPPEPTAESHSSLLHWAIIYVPTLLPLLAIALAVTLIWKKKPFSQALRIVLAGGLALAAACYPRVANNNLLFASPLLIAFLFMAGAQLLEAKSFRFLSMAAIALFTLATLFSLDAHSPYAPQSTQLGNIECRLRDLPNIEFATAAIHPGETLFVYPYQPIWYSLTGGVNPTSYDFLQPGMMTLTDESRVLQELQAKPPDWVIWHNLSPRTVLSIWPHSDPATLHFYRIEGYIRSRYAQVRPPEAGYKYAIAIFNRIGSQRN